MPQSPKHSGAGSVWGVWVSQPPGCEYERTAPHQLQPSGEQAPDGGGTGELTPRETARRAGPAACLP